MSKVLSKKKFSKTVKIVIKYYIYVYNNIIYVYNNI